MLILSQQHFIVLSSICDVHAADSIHMYVDYASEYRDFVVAVVWPLSNSLEAQREICIRAFLLQVDPLAHGP